MVGLSEPYLVVLMADPMELRLVGMLVVVWVADGITVGVLLGRMTGKFTISTARVRLPT